MKTTAIKPMMLALLFFVWAGCLQAQIQSPPRLLAPVLIPVTAPERGAASGMPRAVSIPTIPEQQIKKREARPQPAAPEKSAPQAVQEKAPAPALIIHDGFKKEMSGTGQRAEEAKPKAATDTPGAAKPGKAVTQAEMIARMRVAVEQIAAEYGNPTFAQVFTNDSLQAQALRKRVQLLHRAEAIRAEIAGLEKQKLEARGELEAARMELLALQKQADALTDRLQKGRVLLGMSH